jgi:hypothetical protein
MSVLTSVSRAGMYFCHIHVAGDEAHYRFPGYLQRRLELCYFGLFEIPRQNSLPKDNETLHSFNRRTVV